MFHSMFIFARHFHTTCFVVEPETKTAVEAVNKITIQFLLMFWGKSLHFTSYHWNWCHVSIIKNEVFLQPSRKSWGYELSPLNAWLDCHQYLVEPRQTYWRSYWIMSSPSFWGHLNIQNLWNHHHLQDHPRTCKWSRTMGIGLWDPFHSWPNSMA